MSECSALWRARICRLREFYKFTLMKLLISSGFFLNSKVSDGGVCINDQIWIIWAVVHLVCTTACAYCIFDEGNAYLYALHLSFIVWKPDFQCALVKTLLSRMCIVHRYRGAFNLLEMPASCILLISSFFSLWFFKERLEYLLKDTRSGS